VHGPEIITVLLPCGSTVYAVALYPSVTSQCSTKMAKCRIMETMPYYSLGTLVFWCQKS